MRNYFKLHSIFKGLNLALNSHNIRIIGTNGKGSTARFLALMLSEEKDLIFSEKKLNFIPPKELLNADKIDILSYCEEKYSMQNLKLKNLQKNSENFARKNLNKIAHFSSPHFYDVMDRFWCNYLPENELKDRADRALGYLLDKLKEPRFFLVKNLDFFELFCALLPLIFYDADVLIIESGIGAKHDSTGVFEYFLNLICPISLDHLEYFKNLEEIYAEKCYGQGAFISAQKCEQLEFLKRFNKQIFYLNYEKFAPKNEQKFFNFLDENFALANAGYFYIKNKLFGPQKITLNMPARMQKICGILLDVAHNEAGAKALAQGILKQNTKKNFAIKLNAKKDNFAVINSLIPAALKFYAIDEFSYEFLSEFFSAQNPEKFGGRFCEEEILKSPDNWAFAGSFAAAKYGLGVIDRHFFELKNKLI